MHRVYGTLLLIIMCLVSRVVCMRPSSSNPARQHISVVVCAEVAKQKVPVLILLGIFFTSHVGM